MSRKIKAQDQYGTVLTLPKGMKPHVKSGTSANDAAEEATSKRCFLSKSFAIHLHFLSLDDGKSTGYLF